MQLKKVLFVLTGSSDFPKLYARVVLPLIHEAERRDIECLAVPVSKPVLNYLTEHHVKSKYVFNKVGFTRIAVNMISLGFKLVRLWMMFLTMFKTKNERIHTKDKLRFGFTQRVFKLVMQKERNRIIDEFKPELLFVIPDIEDFMLPFLDFAEKAQIPTLTATSTMIDDNHPHGLLRADKVAVSGEAFKQIYLKKGNSESRIAVTGMTYFDEIMKRSKQRDCQHLWSHGVDCDKPIVVFLTENLDFGETWEWLNTCIIALERCYIPDVQLVVKVHPRERTEQYQRKIGQRNIKVIVTRDLDCYSLVSQAEIVVGGFSTLLWESMLFDKPIISLAYYGEDEKVPYAKFGAALFLKRKDVGEFRELLNQCFNDWNVQTRLAEGRQKFMDYYAYRADGKSCERVLQLMEEMVSENHHGSSR